MARSPLTPLLLPALLALASVPGHAQQHKAAAPQTVVRAVGLFEWTGDLAHPTASRFLPISIYIDGQLQDADVYLSRPIPFAIDPGNVYSLDEAGLSRGTLDIVDAARLANSDVFDDPWYAGARFVPTPVTKAPALRPVRTLSTIHSDRNFGDKDSGRPKLVNRSPDANPSTSTSTASNKPSPDPGTTAPASSGGSSTNSTTSDDDPDRPTLRRRTAAEQQEAANETPVVGNKKGRIPSASVSGPSTSLNNDPDRPTLHRGGEKAADTPNLLSGYPAGMHQIVGVSDAADRPAHPFARPWDDPSEKAAITAQLETMARTELAAYEKANPLPPTADTTTRTANAVTPAPANGAPVSIAALDKAPPRLRRGVATDDTTTGTPAASAPTKRPAAAPAASSTSSAGAAKTTPTAKSTPAARRRAAARKAAMPPPPPSPEPLLDEQVHGYLLSYGGDPTFVFTAHTAGRGAGLRYITLVAQQDPIENQLHLALHSVTDALHLDRTPDLRLIDAVDADASNRASLLFELRNQSSRQFAFYRVLSGRADQIFVTGTTP